MTKWALGLTSDKFTEITILKQVEVDFVQDVYDAANDAWDDPWGLPSPEAFGGRSWDPSAAYVIVQCDTGHVYDLAGLRLTTRNLYHRNGAPQDDE